VGRGVALTTGRTEAFGAGGVVGNCVIFIFSGSFLAGGAGFFSDGNGKASNTPCKPRESSSIGRTQNCKEAGKFF
jgi:hypothetical protein